MHYYLKRCFFVFFIKLFKKKYNEIEDYFNKFKLDE